MTAALPLAPVPVAPPAPANGRHARPWSRAELDILTAHYAQGGSLACAPYLPHRPLPHIASAAHRLGLRYAGYRFQAPSDPRTDALIRDLYAQGRPPAGAMRDLCVRLQRPRQWVRMRAIALGVIRHVRGPNWRPEEDALLAEFEGRGARYLQQRLVAAGFASRSEAAIAERCRHLALCAVQDRSDHYTVTDLMTLLGITNHRVIGRWLARGDLKARRDCYADGGTWAWRIARADLRTFLIEHPMVWWPGRCDRHWLIELLAGRVGPKVRHD